MRLDKPRSPQAIVAEWISRDVGSGSKAAMLRAKRELTEAARRAVELQHRNNALLDSAEIEFRSKEQVPEKDEPHRRIAKEDWDQLMQEALQIDKLAAEARKRESVDEKIDGIPQQAEKLLYLLPKNLREPLLGDLEEQFPVLCRKFGGRYARRWYWWQVVVTVGYAIVRLFARLASLIRQMVGG